METENLEIGFVYLFKDLANPDNPGETISRVYFMISRDPEYTLREHGTICLSELQEGSPNQEYCIKVFDGRFIDLMSNPATAPKDEIQKRMELIGKISSNNLGIIKNSLELIESRFPRRLKFYGY